MREEISKGISPFFLLFSYENIKNMVSLEYKNKKIIVNGGE